jgi:hypothetical protein
VVLHNDVPWGLIWFAFLAIVWIIRGIARLAKAAQGQTQVVQAKVAAARPQSIADRVAAATVAASAAAIANARQVAPARPPQPISPPPPAAAAVRRIPAPVARAVVPSAHHDPGRLHAAQLLAPFTHPNRLLASIVVAEALRPPLGLRPFDQR